MKHSFVLLSSFLLVLFANAKTRTVCNYPNKAGQDSTIQAAIGKSSNGDTILVQGSPVEYAGFTINNIRLTIIGPGWWPLRQMVPTLALTAKVKTSSINGAGASGTELQGLHFVASGSESLIISNSASINDIRLIRNHFSNKVLIGTNGTGISYSGYVVEGNWFDNNTKLVADKDCNYHNFMIQNNIFNGTRIAYFSNLANTNILINHNVFFNRTFFYPFLNDFMESGTYSQYLTIQNNIFYNSDLTYARYDSTCQCNYLSLGNSVLKNNITYNSSTTAPWTTNGNVNGSGNLNNTNPNVTDAGAILNGNNDPSLNFVILNGPAKNTATDGKDMGLLFDTQGSLNWTNSRMSRIPYIFNFSISNPNIAPGGSVQITIDARRNN